MSRAPASRYIAPLAVFLAMVALLAVGLGLDPREVPSPLVGKPAPHFELPVLDRAGDSLSNDDLKGAPWILNVWASWCAACRIEHPLLIDYAARHEVTLVGLNYKDDPAAGRQWLADLGDPYSVSVIDIDGAVGLDWGVYGVPETFVIDAAGVIRYKHIGPLTADALRDRIQPLLNEKG